MHVVAYRPSITAHFETALAERRAWAKLVRQLGQAPELRAALTRALDRPEDDQATALEALASRYEADANSLIEHRLPKTE